MADDYTQRPPYRPNEPPARGQPAKALGGASDPLAELARLIGQNDPFSEYGRDGVRRPAPPQPPEPVSDWDAAPPAPGYEPEPLPLSFAPEVHQPAPSFPRQSFGGAPLGSGLDLYQVEDQVPGYPPPHAAPNYEDVPYNQSNAHLDGEDDGYYEDEQPSRRRITVLAIAGIFALAVIGTAGAFGYRALFGSSSASGPPPVIKADSTPSKVVPAAVKDSSSNKQITDRVNEMGIGEKLVSREEQPVAAQPQDPAPNTNNQPPSGSGVVGSEPKKVRTIIIRPDGSPSTDSAAPAQMPPPAAAPQAPPPRVVNVTPAKPAAPTPPPRVNNPPEEAADQGPRSTNTRVAPPARHAAAEPAPANAPLSLSPDAQPSRPARAAAPAARAAAIAPAAQASAPAAAASSGSYAVQVSSQRSEADAQAAFRTLQGKYPGQLGGKQPIIRQVDLGDKGVYYRAMVPAGSSSEASELCTSLKAAGGSCVIQRN